MQHAALPLQNTLNSSLNLTWKQLTDADALFMHTKKI
ncbi:hypothetical protein VII00023_19034 [Vibrio ichthyoenteri ATCC 700023]|uniref:Uncharacterized protein n=1 Tax=Vibrio ichthyoenteri ATCC 700023 TaxID=870968 RepID=F9S274_9VIBR|nr:hypothetical protein VII00023_19034 [Vibrio ichthyoenteri ATCC 700023]